MSMIRDILTENDYSLCLAPGFYCYYAELGIVHALQELSALRAKFVSGASAGAIVGSFVAAGIQPGDILPVVFGLKSEDLIDLGGIGGIIKGQRIQQFLEKTLPVKNIEDCKYPLGLTAWNLAKFQTNILTSGNLATAIRASACFPVLFGPVMIDGWPHIDGGVFDKVGMMALPGIPEDNLIVNIITSPSQLSSSVVPEKYPNAKLLTIVMDNIPSVNPLSIETQGVLAYNVARAAMHRALCSGHTMQMHHDHWVLFVDGALVNPSAPIPTPTNRVHLHSDDNTHLPHSHIFPIIYDHEDDGNPSNQDSRSSASSPSSLVSTPRTGLSQKLSKPYKFQISSSSCSSPRSSEFDSTDDLVLLSPFSAPRSKHPKRSYDDDDDDEIEINFTPLSPCHQRSTSPSNNSFATSVSISDHVVKVLFEQEVVEPIVAAEESDHKVAEETNDKKSETEPATTKTPLRKKRKSVAIVEPSPTIKRELRSAKKVYDLRNSTGGFGDSDEVPSAIKSNRRNTRY